VQDLDREGFDKVTFCEESFYIGLATGVGIGIIIVWTIFKLVVTI